MSGQKPQPIVKPCEGCGNTRVLAQLRGDTCVWCRRPEPDFEPHVRRTVGGNTPNAAVRRTDFQYHGSTWASGEW